MRSYRRPCGSHWARSPLPRTRPQASAWIEERPRAADPARLTATSRLPGGFAALARFRGRRVRPDLPSMSAVSVERFDHPLTGGVGAVLVLCRVFDRARDHECFAVR